MPLSLPPPAELERRARLIAYLDTLLEPELSLRYFDFNGAWNKGERMFSMRSGEGDHAFAWFGAAGALVRGKHSERKAVPEERLFEGLPPAMTATKKEPAFQLGGDSLATWAPRGKSAWQSAKDPLKGGMGDLLGVLDGDPKSFAKYANDYHDVKLDLAALGSFYEGGAVTPEWIAGLSDAIDPVRALALAKELGLPTRGNATTGKKGASAKPRPGASSPRIAEEPLGDAEFKIVRHGNETMLVVGGKIQLKAARKDLYYEIIEQVRVALRAAGAK